MPEKAISDPEKALWLVHDLPSTDEDEDSTDDPFLLKHIVGVSLLLMTLVLIDIALLWRNNGVLNVVLATAVNNLIILNYLYYETKIYEDMTSEQNLSLDRCISVTALSLSLANFVKICVV